MNSNLVPKQIKNIHVVHDLLNSGYKIQYLLNLDFKPDIVLIKLIVGHHEGVATADQSIVKILSNIDNSNPVIATTVYASGFFNSEINTILKVEHIPNMLEFTILDMQDSAPSTSTTSLSKLSYDISFIKY